MNIEKLIDTATLTKTIKAIIVEACDKLTDLSDEDRKQWVVDAAYMWLEAFDNAIPVVGGILDTPLADRLERKMVEDLVDVIANQLDKAKSNKQKK